MSDEGSWYHCGRCGHVYGGEEVDLCPACGKSPVVPEAEMAYVMAGSAANPHPGDRSRGTGKSAETDVDGAGGQRRKKRKKSSGVLWFAVGWMGLLGLVAGGVAMVKAKRPKATNEASMGIGDSSERVRMLNEAYHECRQRLVDYWSAAAPETRAEHTLNPEQTLRRMVGSGITLTTIKDAEELKLEMIDTIETRDGTAVVSIWNEPDLGRIEAVFRKNEDGEWKLDWEQMTRYSSTSWGLFLSGAGPASGEFRVFARRRTASSGGEGDGSLLVFSGPTGVGAMHSGLQSPEVAIDPRSVMTRKFAAAFEMREQGKGVFGSRFTETDPIGMIRVRVRLSRGEKDDLGKYQLTLDEVMAFHWMEIEDPGIEVKED
ncbi:MAG: hypothetical protein RLZ97_545 [Verrucomicrobiota bacterium]|jgi:hypothetical protein